MASAPLRLVVGLDEPEALDPRRVGSKAHNLGRLRQAGYRVPKGFALSIEAYERFVSENDLLPFLQMELGRKPLDQMRWEELWDAALRVRSQFLSKPLPPSVRDAILRAAGDLQGPLAVRSSAPGEDSAGLSFAGLHESVTGVSGETPLLDAVRIVWASLWSDAALLYRREMALDPRSSRMAVVVQEMIAEDRSGVAFGRDPRGGDGDVQIVEAVPGGCSGLVDGEVDPDRWMLRGRDGAIVNWRPGRRDDGAVDAVPLLDAPDLATLHEVLCGVESLLQCPPDVEWTGRGPGLWLLQARPITRAPDDARAGYLSLRPRGARLRDLRRRVVEELIPDLAATGARLAAEDLSSLDAQGLADSLQARAEAVRHWRDIYTSDFIPFAHGVRTLGVLYNDLVRPRDPYEFVGLLKGQDLLAFQRNRAFMELACALSESRHLLTYLESELLFREWDDLRPRLVGFTGGAAFLQSFDEAMERFMDLTYQGQRQQDHPREVVHVLMQQAIRLLGLRVVDAGGQLDREQGLMLPEGGRVVTTDLPMVSPIPEAGVETLEQRLRDATPPDRRHEVEDILETARLSWRLRDDDNLLLGRVESQLLRAMQDAERRLRASERLTGRPADEKDVGELADLLRGHGTLHLSAPEGERTAAFSASLARSSDAGAPAGGRPRQLVGQPASQGIASGSARVVTGPDDLGRFRAGEVLVCDAIQPTMTHLVPLAAAVVERRGGMLIHGAIIARELGIPCVNGVENAARILESGTLLTVDGYLGIVTVGDADFGPESSRLPDV